MAKPPPPRWWVFRRAQNRKPATYRCPLCGRHLPALSEHMLIAPENDAARRRHAHTACALAARRDGRLPTREEWLRTQPGTRNPPTPPTPPTPPGLLARLRGWWGRLSGGRGLSGSDK